MTVQTVDFLPSTYRQQQVQRRQRRFHAALTVFFVVCISAGTVAQRRSQAALQAELETLRSHAERMAGQLDNPQVLREAIVQEESRARLRAALRLRLSLSPLLTALSQRLPPQMALTEFAFQGETVNSPAPPAAPNPSPAPPGSVPAPPEQPEAADLAALEQRHTTTHWVISVSGIAPHDAAVAEFFAALKGTGLFAAQELLFTDEYEWLGHPLRRFSFRLTVREPTPEEGAPPVSPSAEPAHRRASPGAPPKTAGESWRGGHRT